MSSLSGRLLVFLFNDYVERGKFMSNMVHVDEIFGMNVFNDAVASRRLPTDVYCILKNTIEQGSELDTKIADVVAAAG